MKLALALVLSIGVLLTSCQLFRKGKEALQNKIIEAAKQAVINLAYSKIDKNEKLDDATKEFLKVVAKDLIEKTFARLLHEYQNYSQEQIEEDANRIVEAHMNVVTSAYLKTANKKQ